MRGFAQWHLLDNEALSVPAFWADRFAEFDIEKYGALPDCPRAQFFRDLLVTFPEAAGFSDQDVYALAADMTLPHKKTILTALERSYKYLADCGIFSAELEDVLSSFKAKAFEQKIGNGALSVSSDEKRFDIFMLYLSGRCNKDLRDARARFYKYAPIPEALKDYHLGALKRLKDSVSGFENIKTLASIMLGIKMYHRRELTPKFSEAVSTLIANAYDIPVPETDPEEADDIQGAGACRAPDWWAMASKISYKYSEIPDSASFMKVAFHEVGGHAVENILARRSCARFWDNSSPAFKRRFPRLDADTPLAKGALMLAFNNRCNHIFGHYFMPEDGQERYRDQLNEKLACWTTEINGETIVRRLQDLYFLTECFRHLRTSMCIELDRAFMALYLFPASMQTEEIKDLRRELKRIERSAYDVNEESLREGSLSVFSRLIDCIQKTGQDEFLNKIQERYDSIQRMGGRLDGFAWDFMRALVQEMDRQALSIPAEKTHGRGFRKFLLFFLLQPHI